MKGSEMTQCYAQVCCYFYYSHNLYVQEVGEASSWITMDSCTGVHCSRAHAPASAIHFPDLVVDL